VVPPWWRTWWALCGYVMAFVGLISGIVHLRTRALRLQAEHLESVVVERTRALARRTADLARQNTELIRLHQLELDEKISARLAEEKARLEVLRYQLNPHFLFNTLASISAALPPSGATARAMIERLADFCRRTLHRSDEREWTTLGEEMELLRAYLEIERSRWGDLLEVGIVCDTALTSERLPTFLLLPLLENALKYGRATSTDRVGIRLVAQREPGSGALVVEVANTGRWIEPTARKTVSTLGIGLENLRERLARNYPGSHRLTFSSADGWVVVTLRIEAVRGNRAQGLEPPEPGAGASGT
jgi:LytS/YehU family sensor histidine kinase